MKKEIPIRNDKQWKLVEDKLSLQRYIAKQLIDNNTLLCYLFSKQVKEVGAMLPENRVENGSFPIPKLLIDKRGHSPVYGRVQRISRPVCRVFFP
jgi:hypothetical protein